jgi:2-aminoadipate transaminase
VLDTLCDPGDIVLCTAPTYLVILGTMANLRVRAISVRTDDEGIVPSDLTATLQRLAAANELSRVKAIYLVTYFDNPRGVTLATQRRQQVLDVACKWSRQSKIRVIEDIAYRELRYDGEDVPSLLSLDKEADRVILAGTFSKSFSPGIRVGWGVLPAELIGPVLDQKGNIDFGSPNFNQHAMYQVLASDRYDAHIERLRHAYRAKRDAMLTAADQELAPLDGVHWEIPGGGLYIWVELPEHVDTGPQGQLFNVALEEGVLYVPGEFFFPSEGEPRQTNCLRLSFGVQTPAGIAAGMRGLGRAIQACS